MIRVPKARSEPVPAMKICDIHSHVCPGIDDGPADVETAIDMLELGFAGGTREVVFTPHMFLDPFNNCDARQVANHYGRFVAALEQASAEPGMEFLAQMRFYLGSENYVSVDFVSALDQEEVLTINQGRCLLIEFTPFFQWVQYQMVVERVRSSGLIPVIAHCERYPPIQANLDRAERLVEMGCLLQVNAQSLLGSARCLATQTCHKLLDSDLAFCIASDAHSLNRRPLQLTPSLMALQKRYSPAQINAWLVTNPSRIVHGF